MILSMEDGERGKPYALLFVRQEDKKQFLLSGRG